MAKFRIFLLFVLMIFLLIILFWAFFPYLSPDGTGFAPYVEGGVLKRGKTLWDWLELLIIPLILGIGIWWLNKKEKEDSEKIEQTRQVHATLEAYFDCMTNLILKEGLRSDDVSFVVATLARTRTLQVLRSVDGNSKGTVLQFLYEAGLIQVPPVIDLEGADFSGIQAEGARMSRATLCGIDFENANFNHSSLKDCMFMGNNFTGAKFCNCSLLHNQFSDSIMDDTDFHDTDMSRSEFSLTSFKRANLTNTRLTKDQLESIASLEGAKGVNNL